jgi:aromatic ring-opening dioxygenase LigB subunit
MSLVFACIAPHGDVDLAPELRAAMEELGRRFATASPEVAVIVTPHSVHVEGHFAVVMAGKVGEWETDRELAAALLEAPLPILGVSYGGNDPRTAEFPLDWGTEVPLAFMRAAKVVVVSPARDRPLEEHLRLGEAIAALPGRVALVASADNGHAHDADGPYGYDPAAASYDAQLREILASDRLDFLPLAELVEPAKADSLWQLLVLQGALGETARADVLAYAAPTYYGMLVAEVMRQEERGGCGRIRPHAAP